MSASTALIAGRCLIALGLVLAADRAMSQAQRNGSVRPIAPAAPPSPRPAEAKGGGPLRAGKTELVPFLGMIFVQATPAERTQAGLTEGVGLSVLYVVAGSPAQGAGLQRSDVLHKFDDQILINEPQFRVLLRNTKPGGAIQLTVIRGGKSQKVTVRPIEREVAVIEGTSAGTGLWSLGPSQASPSQASRLAFSARYEDDAHVLELRSDPRGKYLLVKDKQGSVVFQGEVNTADQRKAVPATVRPKLEKLENPPPSKVQPAPAPSQPAPGLS